MSLDAEAFERVASGKKVIEVRLFDEKRKKLRIGDQINFFKLPDKTKSITVNIAGLSNFKTFKKLFETFGEDKFGYSCPVKAEELAERMYKHYSKKEEAELGVIVIHIEK